MAFLLPAVPFKSPILDDKPWLIGRDFSQWFQAIKLALDTAARRAGDPIGLSAQAASLAAQTLLNVTTTGLYRVSWYARITQAATTSSSLQVTIRWVDGGVAQSSSNAAITGNTTTTLDQATHVLKADAGTAITIETTRASVGGTPMQHSLDARVEAMP